jgi:MFS family permease
MYGKRKMMVFALVSTAVGSLLGGVSDELGLLIAARAFQGIGLALIPVGMAIMRDELPREKVPVGVALMSASLGIGAGLGLPLSGLIVEHLGWHAIFWLTGGVCAVLIGTVLAVLPESSVRTRGQFDLRGAVLLTLALTAVLLALSKGAMWGWTSLETIGLAAVGITGLLVLVPLEMRTPSPLVDVRIAARPALLLVNTVAILAGFAMFVNVLITTQLLQLPKATGYGLGLDVLETSLWMIPNAVAFGLIAPISARLTRLISPQFTLLSGAVVMCLAYIGRVFFSVNLPQIVVGSVIVGVGSAMMFAALPTLVMRVVPETETASANGMNVLLRSFGTAAASAATAAISTASVITVAGRDLPTLGALTSLFWLAAVAVLGAALFGIPMLRMSEYTEEPDRSDGVARA